MIPGEIFYAEDDLELNTVRERKEIDVANTGDRPIQVGSHFRFFEVNRALRFDASASLGKAIEDVLLCS